MRALIALTGHEIDHDIAAAAARMLDPARDQILAVHVVHPREVQPTLSIRGSGHRPTYGEEGLVVSGDTVDATLIEDAGQAVERVEGELRDHVDDLKRDHFSEFSVEFDVLVDKDPADAIIEAVSEQGIGSIVMGTRGRRSRFTAAVLGSSAEEVVRRSTVPVLIVKEGMLVDVDPR